MIGINFRGQTYEAVKHFWQGTHRTVSPSETLARVKPYFPSIQLTRLANITHLDRLGIPVTLSIRPNSYSLVTSCGKGITLEAALASAAMESIELYWAENLSLPTIKLPYSQLIQEYKTIPLSFLPLRKHSLFEVHRPEKWVFGWDLLNQEEVAVPYHVVSMDSRFVCEDFTELAPFEMNSNGLASGNHLLEAVTCALHELLERDAVACHHETFFQFGYQPPRVDLTTIESPAILDLIERFESAEVGVLIYDCMVDTQIPVYQVICYDRREKMGLRCSGYGCHLDPEVAMLRALTEAAQVRGVYIAGSRDDLFRDYYQIQRIQEAKADIKRVLESHLANIDARAHSSQATETFAGDITVILKNLEQIGVNQVIIVDLSPPDWGITVVRAIVPQLEGFFGGERLYKKRAIAFAQKKHQQTLS